MTAETLSVGQLQRKSKNAVAREFRGPVWVSGEIRNLREHRGNLYITLVEPGDFVDGTDITLDVAAWARRAALLKAQTDAAGVRLVAGMQVRISGQVTLSKTGRLMVELAALDVEALLGDQAAEKKRLYEALRREGLLDANKTLPVPSVPLRVGLITSENSEGCNDFLGQLSRSPYAFDVRLSHTPVQGPAAPNAIARAVRSFDGVDLIALVRGGGGELDAFDKEVVARAICSSSIPVWTGIGHTGDHAVADDVAHSSFVTPTECGQAIVRLVRDYHVRVTATAARLCVTAGNAVATRRLELDHRVTQLGRAAVRSVEYSQSNVLSLRAEMVEFARRLVANRHAELLASSQRLRVVASRPLDAAASQLSFSSKHLLSVDPKRPLMRGYSLTYLEDGTLLTDPAWVAAGANVVTELAHGRIVSTVSSVKPGEQARPDKEGR